MEWIKEEGLRFGCTQCGKCCTGEPGYVWLDEADIENLSTELKLSRQEFLKRYTRFVDDHYALLEMPRTFDCIFLEGKQCRVYKARPKQCGTFPFWPENLATKEAWEGTAKRCEGINSDAPLVSLKRIKQVLEE